MRQVVLAAAGELRIEQGPLPEPGPGELRGRAEAVGICGSEAEQAFRAAIAGVDGEPAVKIQLEPQR